MWIDATVAASFVTNPKDSTVADKVGFALAPDTGLGKRGNWLWAWSLAIPAGSDPEGGRGQRSSSNGRPRRNTWRWSRRRKAGPTFPPGTRTSLYENPEYAKVPFAKMTLDSINAADPTKPTVDPVPYVGVQFVAIPEFQGIGTAVGPGVLRRARRTAVRPKALAKAQALTTDEMEAAGY